MSKPSDLVQGTLDLLILRVLALESMHGWGIAQRIQELERVIELDRRLPAILNGKAKPADAAETLGFAGLCSMKKLQAASARLSAAAFQAP